MWKYTHTDEMYHSLTNRNNSTELFHSDVYLGQEFSDGLKHFKYLKRERKNGKWVYYYSNEEYNAAKKKQAQAEQAHKIAADKARQTQNQYDEATNNIAKAKLRYNINEALNKNNKGLINKIKYNKTEKKLLKEIVDAKSKSHNTGVKNVKAQSEETNKSIEARSAKKEAEKVEKKTKVHRAVGETLAKAANKLSDASYNTKKSVEKGKKKVNDAINKLKKKKNKKSVPRTYLVNK